ncbi:MAG TPA: hypothetical protein VFG53_01000 [Anaeromyxobacter sp.]|nr:hypothetical protein [Anaeromyxobacter sp.]
MRCTARVAIDALVSPVSGWGAGKLTVAAQAPRRLFAVWTARTRIGPGREGNLLRGMSSPLDFVRVLLARVVQTY